ncbi:A/G-specific DNA-adenine glycosylase [Breznakia blatticola]|uniref:Adenine DNA glycosylase n=1 Tax=Breznakia blatticola TaxID=1754012 RepID=A0A4R7ZAC7_9FIRM|nr:A/G-specific adenine glycosylase [Breznakia blatticola]TDW10463.1 A/G-specific DNA-adenine glycosylase [Breznakia blatticola]
MNSHIERNSQLLAWYGDIKRLLPWRITKDAYKIWISEIMLQQTRVEAVIPYFERFITKLPTLEALAMVDDETLYKLWEGLGYYRRARFLKEAAKVCMDTYNGRLPNTYKELLTLPGVGMYTAAAIASIAFDQAVPAVDGNVLRVYARVHVCDFDIAKEKTKRFVFEELQQEVDPNNPGDYNQAMMELGSQVCIGNGTPRCNICPIASSCSAYKQGLQNSLPVKSKLKERRKQNHTILILRKDHMYYVHKRTKGILMEHMYEFMNIEHVLKKKEIEQLIDPMYGIVKIKKFTSHTHVYSHVEWNMQAYVIDVKQIDDHFVSWQMIQEKLPMAGAMKKFIQEIEKETS